VTSPCPSAGLDQGVARLHGQGPAEVCPVDASSEDPAVRAIVVDAATTAGRRLYAKLGFVAAPNRPGRMLIRTETVVKALNR
jgi:hypothetical protein